MATLAGTVDGMVKEYLMFRGFTATLKSFESEVKTDKDKSFRVEKIIDQIQAYVTSYDLNGLRSYWTHLDRRFFAKLNGQAYHNIKILEAKVLRMYLVHAIQNSKAERIYEFFDKLSPELQGTQFWNDWFAIPFIKNPEQNPTFSMYFTKVWQESLLLGLYNCLDTIFSRMNLPALLNFEKEKERLGRIEAENTSLREQIASLQQEIIKLKSLQRLGKKEVYVQATSTKQESDMDNFTVISGSNGAHSTSSPRKFPKGKLGWKFRVAVKDAKERKKTDRPSRINEKDEKYEIDREELLRDKRKDNAEAARVKREVVASDSLPAPPHPKDLLFPSSVDKSTASYSSLAANHDERLTEESASLEPGFPNHSSESSVFYMSLGEKPTSSLLGNITHKIACSLPGLGRIGKDAPSRNVETVASPSSSTSTLTDIARPEEAQPTGTRAKAFQAEGGVHDCKRPFVILSQETFSDHMAPVINCQFSYQGTSVASIDVDGVVKIWECSPTPCTLASIVGKPQALSFGWIPKVENLILLGKSNGKIVLYDSSVRKAMAEMTIDCKFPRISYLLTNPSGTSFVCSAVSANNPALGKRASSFSVRTPTLGKRLAKTKSHLDEPMIYTEGTLYSWNLETLTLEVELALEPHAVAVHSIAYNKEGTMMVCGGADGMIRLFDTKTHDCLVGWHGHSSDVYDIQFNVDESSIFSVGGDRKLCIWDVRRVSMKLGEIALDVGALGTHDTILNGNSHDIAGHWNGFVPTGQLFSFDPDGRYLMIGSQSTTLIYEVNKTCFLKPVMHIGGHVSPVTCLDWSFSATSSTCVTGQSNGPIQSTTLLRK